MTAEALAAWGSRFEAFLRTADADAAHGLDHVRRVVATATTLAELEAARPDVVVPAAWLHDCVTVPKDSPERASASRLAAERASAYLRAADYSEALIPEIAHAIHAHSFSAGVSPRTLEARVVQDADRLDAIGAIGLARMLMLGGAMGMPLYDPGEPFPTTREPDDWAFVLDHFYTKLLRLAGSMQTDAGRLEAERRTRFLEAFLHQLATELPG